MSKKKDTRKNDSISNLTLSLLDNKIKEENLIILELVEALKNCNEDLLAEIMLKFRLIPNKQLLILLKQFIIDYDPNIKEIEEENGLPEGSKNFIIPKRKFIKINNEFIIELKFLNRADKDDTYKNGIMNYRIIINKDSEEKMFYANSIINFPSEESRNLEFAKILKKMKFNDIVFI